MIASLEPLPPNEDRDMIPVRDFYFRDGRLRKELLIDGKWTELYTQENAIAFLEWSDVVSVTEKFWMPYTEAKNKFGHLPNFPKI